MYKYITKAFNNVNQKISYTKGYLEGAQVLQKVEQSLDDSCDLVDCDCCDPFIDFIKEKFKKNFSNIKKNFSSCIIRP